MKKNGFVILVTVWILCITAFIYFGYVRDYPASGRTDLIDTVKKIETSINLIGRQNCSLAEVLNRRETKYSLLVFYNKIGQPNEDIKKMLENMKENDLLYMEPIMIEVGESKTIGQLQLQKDVDLENYTISWDEFNEAIPNGKVPFIAIADKRGNVKFSITGWDSQNTTKLLAKKIYKYK